MSHSVKIRDFFFACVVLGANGRRPCCALNYNFSPEGSSQTKLLFVLCIAQTPKMPGTFSLFGTCRFQLSCICCRVTLYVWQLTKDVCPVCCLCVPLQPVCTPFLLLQPLFQFLMSMLLHLGLNKKGLSQLEDYVYTYKQFVDLEIPTICSL